MLPRRECFKPWLNFVDRLDSHAWVPLFVVLIGLIIRVDAIPSSQDQYRSSDPE